MMAASRLPLLPSMYSQILRHLLRPLMDRADEISTPAAQNRPQQTFWLFAVPRRSRINQLSWALATFSTLL